jgi:hypothetical protein
MNAAIHPDLTRWLATATRGLPADTATIIRDEIGAHYDDALSEYIAQGLIQSEAHMKAMTDLGTAEATAQGFSDVHRGQWHYMLAAVASALIMLTMLGITPLYYALGLTEGTTVCNLVFSLIDTIDTGLTVYVLLAFMRLLRWRLGVTGFDRLFRLTMGALIFQLGADVTYQMAYSYSMNIAPDNMPSLLAATTWLEVAIRLVSLVSFLTAGTGLIGIGVRLLRLKVSLYGLGKPLAVLVIILGFGLASGTLLVHLHVWPLSALVGLIVSLVHTLIWPTMILIFFRAVFRNPMRPAQLA